MNTKRMNRIDKCMDQLLAQLNDGINEEISRLVNKFGSNIIPMNGHVVVEDGQEVMEVDAGDMTFYSQMEVDGSPIENQQIGLLNVSQLYTLYVALTEE